MQVVIDVNDELVEYFASHNSMMDDGWFSHSSQLLNAFRKGTPLPKGHGDLIDINEVKKKYPLEIDGLDLRSNNRCLHTVMDEAQIIIKADKTESET